MRYILFGSDWIARHSEDILVNALSNVPFTIFDLVVIVLAIPLVTSLLERSRWRAARVSIIRMVTEKLDVPYAFYDSLYGVTTGTHPHAWMMEEALDLQGDDPAHWDYDNPTHPSLEAREGLMLEMLKAQLEAREKLGKAKTAVDRSISEQKAVLSYALSSLEPEQAQELIYAHRAMDELRETYRLYFRSARHPGFIPFDVSVPGALSVRLKEAMLVIEALDRKYPHDAIVSTGLSYESWGFESIVDLIIEAHQVASYGLGNAEKVDAMAQAITLAVGSYEETRRKQMRLPKTGLNTAKAHHRISLRRIRIRAPGATATSVGARPSS